MRGKDLAKKLLKVEKTNHVHSKQLQSTLIVLSFELEDTFSGIRFGWDTSNCVYSNISS